jgi:molybdopterin synthase catalytic subunit
VGGIASFVGLVRDMAGGRPVTALTLDHYHEMSVKMLENIEAEARARWPLLGVTLIHRYGRLSPGERIVFVGTAAAHRQAALDSCSFLIDWLKTDAPFWKEETGPAGRQWVAPRKEDEERRKRWRQ